MFGPFGLPIPDEVLIIRVIPITDEQSEEIKRLNQAITDAQQELSSAVGESQVAEAQEALDTAQKAYDGYVSTIVNS